VDPSGRCFIAGAIDMLIVVDISSSIRADEIKFQAVRGAATAGRASEIALNSGHSVRVLRAMRRNNKRLFKELEDFFKEKVEIHHILEKRFLPSNVKLTPKVEKILQRLGHVDDMPGIVLTRKRHRTITNRWIKELGKIGMKDFRGYSNITIKDLINAAGKVYYDDPVQLQVVMRGILNVAF